MCHKKKKHDEAIKVNNANLREITAAMKVVEAMSKSDTVRKPVAEIIDMLEYASPSASGEIRKLESKIAAKADDLKILVAGDKAEEKILDLAEEIRILVVQRNNLVKAGVQ